MSGFNQRQSSKKKDEEERRKRGQTNKSAQPNSSSKAVAQRPTGAPQRAGGSNLNTVQAPKGLPKPESPKTSRFYTNSEGSTGDGVRPSSARGVATTPPQKGGFPANPNPPRLPPPSSSGQPGPQSNNFYTNKEGQTTRGFGTSSSRAVVPSGPRTGTSLVPVEKPASKPGAAPNTPKEPNYKARAEGKARAAKDTAKYEAQRSKQSAEFKKANPSGSATVDRSAPKESRVQRSRAAIGKGKISGSGKVLGALAAVPEVVDTYNVATDEDTTGLDVANQAAEGAGRWASGMTLGAGGSKLGAMGGSFLGPIGTAAGSVIGGGLGFAAGYTGADKLIDYGREWFGGDSDSPIDEVNERNANSGVVERLPVQPVQEESTQPQARQQPDPNSAGTLQAMPQQPPEQQTTDNNVVFDPETNSFSGGTVGRGYTVNGQAQGGPNIGNPQSDQNRQAIDDLMARTPEFGAGGFQPSQDNRPNFYIGQDSSVDDRIERRMLQSASTPLRGAQNGQLTASQRRTMENHLSGKRRDATTRATNRSNNQTSLQTAQINQQGQNQRSGARLSIDQSRLEGEQQERGFNVRQGQQLENLRNQYMEASQSGDRERASAIAKQLRILNGDGSESNGNFKSVKTTVPVDPSRPGSGTKDVLYSYNQDTGEYGPGPGKSGLPPLKDNPQAMRIAQDTSLSRAERERQIRALGYH